jgi:tetratricopeptide (TPR) repeat protein
MSHQKSSAETSSLEEYQRLLGLLDERRFDEAQVRARLLLESGSPGALLRAKLHNLLCWTFIEGLKNATPESSLHGEEAVRLAAVLGERSLQVQAMCNLASAYHQVGDYDRSRAVYQEIITHLTREPGLVPCGLVIAFQGLAQLDSVLGRPHEALHQLEMARGHCQEGECRFLLADLHRRQALVLLHLQRPEEAAQSLQQIDETTYSSGPRSLWWKTHLSFTRARVELARGHWAEARTLITNTMALARELGDLPVLAESTCLMALLEQAEGRKEAGKRARKALTYAIHTGRRDVVNDIRDRLRPLLAKEL